MKSELNEALALIAGVQGSLEEKIDTLYDRDELTDRQEERVAELEEKLEMAEAAWTELSNLLEIM